MSDNLPSTKVFGDYNSDEDFKDMRGSDQILPRLRLAQFTSKQVKDGLVKAGSYYNSATNGTVIDTDKPGIIVPLMFWLEWNEWNTDKNAPIGVGEGKAILRRETDPNGELAKMAMNFVKIQTPKGERLRVTEYYSFLVLVPETLGWNDVMMLSFSKTSHKEGKLWLNRMRSFMIGQGAAMEKAPMPAVGWELSREKKQKDGDDYFVQKVLKGNLLTPEQFNHTLSLAGIFKARKAEITKSNVAADKEVEAEATSDGNPDL